MAYVPRFTQPESGNPYWTGTAYGGYNRQIIPADYGSLSAWTGSVLANCTGYVHGRWMELGGRTSDNFGISNGNASTYFTYNDGYERGQVPRLGAIACYSGGLYGGAGHVAIVEKINADGSLIYSQSDYGLSIFSTPTVPAGSYNPWSNLGLIFQGFIYHPSISPEPVEPTRKLTVINGTADKYEGKNGDSTSIAWNEKRGYNFHRWEIVDGLGTILNAQNQNTVFTFGASDATIRALDEKQVKKISKVMLYSFPPVYRHH